MALPGVIELITQRFPLRGKPFVQISARGLNTFTQIIPLRALPFITPIDFTGQDFYPLKVDGASSGMAGLDYLMLGDFAFVAYALPEVSDRFCFTDSAKIGFNIMFQEDYTTALSIGTYQLFDVCTTMNVATAPSEDYTTSLNVMVRTLAPVACAVDMTNPFQPTVAVNGTVLFGNSSTLPPSVANTSVLVKYLSGGLTNLNLTDLFNFAFTLDYTGGSFSYTSNYVHTPPALGSDITFFGLVAAITERGEILSNAAKGWIVHGTFGDILLHRQMLLLLNGTGASGVTLTQDLTPYSAQVSGFSTLAVQLTGLSTNYTVRGIAQAIAFHAGISLTWGAQDAPYTNDLPESGSNAMQALSLLAAKVGATLRWDGMKSYVVTYPDKSYGTWTLPAPQLLAAAGMKYTQILDLETGLSAGGQYKSGFQITPGLPLFDPTSTSKNPAGSAPQVQQIAKIGKLLTSDDPAIVFDLPPNFAHVYIQILVSGINGTGGANGGVSIHNYVTDDPHEWFLYDASSIGNEYIFTSNIGGAFINQVKVDSLVMPDNPSVQANHFNLSLACTLLDLSDALKAQNDALANQQAALLAQQQDLYRFVKFYSGEINFLFYGVIPLPGMYASATCDGLTVQGIIESVQFSYPGIVTLTVAQYAQVYWLTPLVEVTAQAVNPQFEQ